MPKGYDQYCPLAHALDLVGERWALLVVRELMRGPKRYTDLADSLGIGTNILAARLRDLEACGIVSKRKLPPPAASRVYELTDYGRDLKGTIRELALWGARSLGPPAAAQGELFPGWLENAVDVVIAPIAPRGRFEFRVGDEIVAVVDGETRPGSVDDPDVVIEGDADGIYDMFVHRRPDCVTVIGDGGLLRELLEVAPTPIELPVRA